jgi:hypothetical protein
MQLTVLLGIMGRTSALGWNKPCTRTFSSSRAHDLDGGWWLKFKRFTSKYHDASRTLPRRWDQSSGSIIQITMLTVDVALKLKFNEGSKIRPWVIPTGLDLHVINPTQTQTQY